MANTLKGAKLTLVLSALIVHNYRRNERMGQCNKILESGSTISVLCTFATIRYCISFKNKGK